MGRTLSDQLTERFYEWERRGRGWNVCHYTVELEPPFEPFFHRILPAVQIDDGRRPTVLSSFVEDLKGIFTGRATQSVDSFQLIATEETPLTPIQFSTSEELVELSLSLPQGEEITSLQAEQLLITLSSCVLPVAFEIVGTKDFTKVQFACRGPDLAHVREQLRAYFPSVVIEKGENSLYPLLVDPYRIAVVDFGLSEEFMRPLKIFKRFDPDPLVGAVAALETLQEGEIALFQVLFEPVRNPWNGSILRSVSDGEGGSFFIDAPEMLSLAREKTRRPLFAALVRAVAIGSSRERSWDIVRGIATSLMQLAEPSSNELIPLMNEDYDNDIHANDVVFRETHRSGMLLNSEELASIVHPPSSSVQSKKLRRLQKKTRPVPPLAVGHALILGENTHHGVTTRVSLSPEQRLRHMHVIGATGTGKSTLLLSLIQQDMDAGSGLAVLDPHGDLIDEILMRVPEKRMDDVVLFDPSDTGYPVGLNILEAHSDIEKNVLVSDLVATFRRLATSWGDQMTTVLGNAISAFLESETGGTLSDLRKFLIEEDYRMSFMKNVRDPAIVYFWEKEFPLLRGGTMASILTRLDTFLRPKIIRNIVSQRKGLDFGSIVEGKKIFLGKLAQGLIGEENTSLLGSLLVSKMHQAALTRQTKPQSEREDFYLYIDEFQNFITPSMAGVLAGARKFHLGFVLAHQEMRSIWSRDIEVAHSLISNPGTRICFRLGDFDAEKLSSGFAHFSAQDLLNLGTGEAIARVERAEFDFNLTTHLTEISKSDSEARRSALVDLTRKKYGHSIVEEIVEEKPKQEVKPVSFPQQVVERRERVEQKPLNELSCQPFVKPVLEAPKVEEKIRSQQHRYYQTLIKSVAEQWGYHVTIEEPTPDDAGRVDCVLERNSERIACEISFTTTVEHELENVRKCLASGYTKVIVCALEKKRLDKIRKVVAETLSDQEQAKVLFFEPDDFFQYLQAEASKGVTKEQMIKGRRVNLQYAGTRIADRKQKQDAIAKVIVESLRRISGKKGSKS